MIKTTGKQSKPTSRRTPRSDLLTVSALHAWRTKKRSYGIRTLNFAADTAIRLCRQTNSTETTGDPGHFSIPCEEQDGGRHSRGVPASAASGGPRARLL